MSTWLGYCASEDSISSSWDSLGCLAAGFFWQSLLIRPLLLFSYPSSVSRGTSVLFVLALARLLFLVRFLNTLVLLASFALFRRVLRSPLGVFRSSLGALTDLMFILVYSAWLARSRFRCFGRSSFLVELIGLCFITARLVLRFIHFRICWWCLFLVCCLQFPFRDQLLFRLSFGALEVLSVVSSLLVVSLPLCDKDLSHTDQAMLDDSACSLLVQTQIRS
jgi:hypothetical protein